MRYIILLVALFSCAEDELTKQKKCFSMQISDSIPIQFWVNGQETFNQNTVCGINQVCFCQPFECDDEITIQFEDDSGSDFDLVIYDVDSLEIFRIPFDDNAGVYSLTFTPSEQSPSICEKVIFKIESQQYHTLYDYSFDFLEQAFEPRAGLGDYWGEAPNNDGWNQTVTKSYVGFTSPNGCWMYDGVDMTFGGINWTGVPILDSEELKQSFDAKTGNFKLQITTSGPYILAYNSAVQVTVYYRLYLDGVMVAEQTQVIDSDGSSPDSGSLDDTLDFGTVTADEIRVYIARTSGTPTVGSFTDLEYTSLDLYIEDYEAASSDCIDLRNNHYCSKLIEYTNSGDFDGINYAVSPQPTFYLRVPAQLLPEENPQTQEDLELSNGVIVTLRQTIQEKYRLKLGFMPAHMHTKVQKILMHDTVTIDGIQWKRRDPYEAPRIEDYPLKKGEVLLTKYNSVIKNTI